MVIFNKLFGGKSKRINTSDSVWINSPAKFMGILNYIEANKDQKSIWLISHFKKSEVKLKTALKVASQIYTEVLDRSSITVADKNDVKVISAENWMRLSHDLRNQDTLQVFLIIEHYPTDDVDQALVNQIADAAPKSEITFYSDMEEPLFKQAGAEGMVALMEKLGFDTEQDLNHPMLSRSIQKSQKKITKTAKSRLPAESAEEWFAKNC